jgi:hypothetical protein
MTQAYAPNIQIRNRAEEEIEKYASSDLLWLKHICNFTPRPQQLMYMAQMDENPFISIVAMQRTGKSRGVDAKCVKWTATVPKEDLRFFAPAVYQARKNLKDTIDIILNSPILLAYIETRLGRRQISSTHFAFMNGSNGEAFGQESNLDGVNATILHLDEFDDMDMEVFKNRILPRGSGKNENGMPTRVILTGTIQEEQGNLYAISQDETFFKAPMINIYHALEAGLIDRAFFKLLKEQLTPDEWLRIALCMYKGGRQFFPQRALRKMQMRGAEMQMKLVLPEFGKAYDSEGDISFGLDMGAQGQQATSSKYSLTVTERVGLWKRYLYGREWAPTTDPKVVKRDIVELWSYFRPRGGFGDAFDSNLIADINDQLYAEGLVSYSRQREGTEENCQGNWDKWPFQPIRFTGYQKHWMLKTLRDDIIEGRFFSPLLEIESDDRWDPAKAKNFSDPAEGDKALIKFLVQCKNIRAERAPSGQYYLYSMIKARLGDDGVDSASMANAFLETGKGSVSGPIEHVSSGATLMTKEARVW